MRTYSRARTHAQSMSHTHSRNNSLVRGARLHGGTPARPVGMSWGTAAAAGRSVPLPRHIAPQNQNIRCLVPELNTTFSQSFHMQKRLG